MQVSQRVAHQCHRHRCLAGVQAVGGLAKQGAAQGVNAHQLALEWHQVQVGLQNLVFTPVPLQQLRRYGLLQLLHHTAPAGATFQVIVQQAGQLHGDGGGATCFAVPQVGPGRSRGCLPVHAAVFVKAFVFTQHQGGAQGGRNIGQRHPLTATHAGIGAQAL